VLCSCGGATMTMLVDVVLLQLLLHNRQTATPPAFRCP
jgi:hypothetical protein